MGYNRQQTKMKKLMSLLAAIFFMGVVFACDVPSGYTERQKVFVYNEAGGQGSYSCQVYHATNMCDAYCICFIGEIYYVSRSDNAKYKYMFFADNKKYYFNM